MKKFENDSIKYLRLIYVLILFIKIIVFSLKYSFQNFFFIEDLNINVYFVNYLIFLYIEVGYVYFFYFIFMLFFYNVYLIVFYFGDCFK